MVLWYIMVLIWIMIMDGLDGSGYVWDLKIGCHVTVSHVTQKPAIHSSQSQHFPYQQALAKGNITRVSCSWQCLAFTIKKLIQDEPFKKWCLNRSKQIRMVWSNWWYLTSSLWATSRFSHSKRLGLGAAMATEKLKDRAEDHIETATLPPLLWLSDHGMTK